MMALAKRASGLWSALLLLVGAVMVSVVSGDSRPQVCTCAEIFQPVCGEDGITYSNSCEAGCAGVGFESQGACEQPEDCVCAEIFQPVCGEDGITYSNSCEAGCAGVGFESQGACEQPEVCVCAELFQPVCGVDGNTYSNSCEAGCAGVEDFTEGPCDEVDDCCPAGEFCCDAACLTDGTQTLVPCGESQCCEPVCVCPAVFLPVCGVDGVTYSNACNAGCAGVEVASPGACAAVDE